MATMQELAASGAAHIHRQAGRRRLFVYADLPRLICSAATPHSGDRFGISRAQPTARPACGCGKSSTETDQPNYRRVAGRESGSPPQKLRAPQYEEVATARERGRNDPRASGKTLRSPG